MTAKTGYAPTVSDKTASGGRTPLLAALTGTVRDFRNRFVFRPPDGRVEQLALANAWYAAASRRTKWNIPPEALRSLHTVTAAASAVLDMAASCGRTPAITARCGETFAALTGTMQDFRSRFFICPPLQNPDLAALGLKPTAAIRTPVPAPLAEAEADSALPDIHLIELVNIRRRGPATNDPRSEYGVRIHFGILDRAPSRYRVTETPQTGEDLPYSFFTRRRRERFDFTGESGKTVYFCLCWETGCGKRGPLGPVFGAVIP